MFLLLLLHLILSPFNSLYEIVFFCEGAARGLVTEVDYNNKYIFTEDLKCIINVSEIYRVDRSRFIRERAIPVHNLPLTVSGCDMGVRNLLMAVKHLLLTDGFGYRSLVCCDFGVNRSRTVIEAFHYAKMGYHFEDEYMGSFNHLIYNSVTGHLPALSELERELIRLRSYYDRGDLEYIIKMKDLGIF